MALEGPRERPRERYRVRHERIGKAGLVARLRELQGEGAISWFLAGARFFWKEDIDADVGRFIGEIQGADFGTAHLCVSVPGRKYPDYSVYEMSGRHAAGGAVPRPAAPDAEPAGPGLAPRRADITRADLIARLRELLKGDGISWLIAGRHHFEWGEINGGKEAFIGKIQGLGFRTVTMGVHVPGKGPEYYFYRVAG